MDFLHIARLLFYGVETTVIVTLTCCITGFCVALFMMASLVAIQSKLLLSVYNAFSYVFRAIPVLVMIFLVYFGMASVMNLSLPPLIAINLSLGLIAAAYLYEVFRGALESVDQAELKVAKAQGMKSYQIVLYIQLPQVLRLSFPGMINEFTSVLKYSPFSYTIGVGDIMKQAMALTATTLNAIEIYSLVGVFYFLIYKCFLFGMQYVNKRFNHMQIKHL
ncbi:ABC transporter permease subunit [Cysteiniphilum sp. QT6929]|uniref:ABC transporter permease subunit n=1 Tax=Cysteiniphilum sp. QT6929 TaxID=2975055 RepID=UPI0024B352D4|nr:ABC transporter permease subunit [Cysteiniphilum sp. QT6929]WHN65094.1 ABC transporter permease subunit [Cysteiniphilum sp. QT6929]